MFEQYAEQFWIALFMALVLYGVSNAIRVPLVVKRFYKKLGFNDEGPVEFDSSLFADSLLLQGEKTSHLYGGVYDGYKLNQFEAYSTQRRKFTVNKAQRKRNQKIWTVTVISLDKPLANFCARPVLVPEAPEYLLNSEAVLFPDHEDFAKRIHVVATDHASARALFNAEVREYLNGSDPDPLALESVQSVLIHRRPRQPHDTGKQLKKDLDAVVSLAGTLTDLASKP